MEPSISSLFFTSHIDKFYIMQIVLVVICAALIGFERQKKDKPLGMRTSILIAVGTMIFVKTGIMMLAHYSGPGGDPTRVIGQVVTGIGFLGAGSIMTMGGLVRGLTTAATIWMQAAIGVLIACGFLADAIIFTTVTLVVLYGISHLELRFLKFFRRKRRKREPEEE